MKTIYLHIGTEKTGTKSIQNFCSKNNEFLKKQGIYYPFDLDRKYIHNITHWPLAAVLSKHKQFVPENKILPAEEMYDQFKKDIDEVPFNSILISAEPFSVNVIDKDAIQQLRNFLKEYNVKIIIYLRRQDDYYISHTSTKIKGGVHIKDNIYNSQEAIDNPLRYNYYQLVSKWSSIFGKENMIIKRFEELSLKNQDILSDFFDIFNLDISMIENQAKKQNVSLSLDALYFMNIMNRDLKLNPQERARIFSLLEKRESKFKIKSLISPIERRKILEHYKDSNESLAKEYLNIKNGKLFEEIKEHDESWEAFHILNAGMTFDICRYLMRHKYGNKMPAKFTELLIKSVVPEILEKQ